MGGKARNVLVALGGSVTLLQEDGEIELSGLNHQAGGLLVHILDVVLVGNDVHPPLGDASYQVLH